MLSFMLFTVSLLLMVAFLICFIATIFAVTYRVVGWIFRYFGLDLDKILGEY
jgi:hypothetical protein